ncbi:MAG: DnaJ domain-containing protein [Candidatus Electronema aureum]|uniref:DnaJ domain-containing protein n=1 Tax=Candidatus Electronema aureum TaxID=2005002 RepID=A0A521G5G3_9BACT|nr:MAG: DnaJ domain-containing protein [Candidatus Electronema aureum]
MEVGGILFVAMLIAIGLDFLSEVLPGLFGLLPQAFSASAPAWGTAGALTAIGLCLHHIIKELDLDSRLRNIMTVRYDGKKLNLSINSDALKSYSESYAIEKRVIITLCGILYLIIFVVCAKNEDFSHMVFYGSKKESNVSDCGGILVSFLLSFFLIDSIWCILSLFKGEPEQKIRDRADTLISQANTSLERTHELDPLEESIKSINAKLGTCFPVDFKSEIQQFVDAHKQELLSDVTRLNNLISEIIKRAKEDFAQLEKADNLYDLVKKFYTETVREVNRSGSSPALLTHLDYIYTYLHSENLKDVLQQKKWNDFHEIVNEILKELTEVKEAAVEILPPEETEEEKACRILGVPLNASVDQIKRMYKALAAVWHPDSNTVKDDTRMKEINWANDVLMKLRN